MVPRAELCNLLPYIWLNAWLLPPNLFERCTCTLSTKAPPICHIYGQQVLIRRCGCLIECVSYLIPQEIFHLIDILSDVLQCCGVCSSVASHQVLHTAQHMLNKVEASHKLADLPSTYIRAFERFAAVERYASFGRYVCTHA